MPTIATEVRPGVIAAVLLTAGLALGLQCAPRSTSCREVAVMRIPPAIVVPMQIQPRFHWFGDFAAVLEPPAHPDARPWPHGMVIAPPHTPDPIAGRLPSALDNLLSALLAPWLSVAS